MKDFNKKLIKRFTNTYELCNGDTNKNMDIWERFNEALLPDKKAFYSELNLEDITDKNYAQAQKVFKEIKLKKLGDYHDFFVQSDTFLLDDVFELQKQMY